MLLLDVNILVYAHRADMPQHGAMRRWLSNVRTGSDRFGVPELARSAFVRVVTRGKPFDPPTEMEAALDFCDALLASPRCVRIQAGARQWDVFEQLCRRVRPRGNLVTDAYFAALAIDQECEWITTDRDYAIFPGLTWRHPLETQARTNPR